MVMIVLNVKAAARTGYGSYFRSSKKEERREEMK
jgi:hypothetical protein